MFLNSLFWLNFFIKKLKTSLSCVPIEVFGSFFLGWEGFGGLSLINKKLWNNEVIPSKKVSRIKEVIAKNKSPDF